MGTWFYISMYFFFEHRKSIYKLGKNLLVNSTVYSVDNLPDDVFLIIQNTK